MRRSAWKPGVAVLANGRRRSYTTQYHDPSKLRNLALVAHIGVLLVGTCSLKADLLQILGKPH